MSATICSAVIPREVGAHVVDRSGSRRGTACRSALPGGTRSALSAPVKPALAPCAEWAVAGTGTIGADVQSSDGIYARASIDLTRKRVVGAIAGLVYSGDSPSELASDSTIGWSCALSAGTSWAITLPTMSWSMWK